MRFIFVATVVLLPILCLGEQVRAENPDPIQQLRQTNKCPNCDLSGADLTGTRLAEADLSGARKLTTGIIDSEKSKGSP